MICSLYGEKAAYLPCRGWQILEKDTEKKIFTAKYYGTHSCPIEVKGCSKDVFKITKEFPSLTREIMVRQIVEQQLQQSSFSAAVTTAKNYTDRAYIEDIKRKEKTKRRPDRHCFKAMKILRTTFEKEDSYLVYDFNDGSDGRLPFVLRSSKLRVKLLQNLDKDGHHRLSNETVYLDVLHSRYVMITLRDK